MGISINDLDGNLNLRDTSLLSSNGTKISSLRELLDEELKISGGRMQKTSAYVNNKKGIYAVYGQGIDFYVGNGFDDITVFGDDVRVFSDDKDINVRKFKRINGIIDDIEDLVDQI